MDDTTPARIGDAYVYVVHTPGHDPHVLIDPSDLATLLARHDQDGGYFHFRGVVHEAQREDGETVQILQGSGAAPGLGRGTIVRYRDKIRLPGLGDDQTDELGRIVEDVDDEDDGQDETPTPPQVKVVESGLPRLGRS
jgi:hypothetical protein